MPDPYQSVNPALAAPIREALPIGATAVQRLQEAFKQGIITTEDLRQNALIRPHIEAAQVATAKLQAAQADTQTKLIPLQAATVQGEFEATQANQQFEKTVRHLTQGLKLGLIDRDLAAQTFQRSLRESNEAADRAKASAELTKAQTANITAATEQSQAQAAQKLQPLIAQAASVGVGAQTAASTKRSEAALALTQAGATNPEETLKIHDMVTGGAPYPVDANGNVDAAQLLAKTSQAGKDLIAYQRQLETWKAIGPNVELKTVTSQDANGDTVHETYPLNKITGAQIAPPTRVVVPRGPEKTAESEKTIRSEFDSNTLVKEYNISKGWYQTAVAAMQQAKSGSPAADIELVNAFQRLVDPGAIVREGQYDIVEQATPLWAKLGNLPDKVKAGVRLNPQQRADLFSGIVEMFKAREPAMRTFYNQQKGAVELQKLSPARALPPEQELFPLGASAASGPPAGTPGTLQSPIQMPTGSTPSDFDKLGVSVGSYYVAPNGIIRQRSK